MLSVFTGLTFVFVIGITGSARVEWARGGDPKGAALPRTLGAGQGMSDVPRDLLGRGRALSEMES